jgi:hypothetical protein
MDGDALASTVDAVWTSGFYNAFRRREESAVRLVENRTAWTIMLKPNRQADQIQPDSWAVRPRLTRLFVISGSAWHAAAIFCCFLTFQPSLDSQIVAGPSVVLHNTAGCLVERRWHREFIVVRTAEAAIFVRTKSHVSP